MNRINIIAAVLAAMSVTVQAGAQVCEVRYQTKNKSRYVHGPVNVECGWPTSVHSA